MRALFINPGGIGDQILLLPTVRLLKEKYPKIDIDLVCEPRSSCIAKLTNLYRKTREFDFKEKKPNIFKLRELIRRRRYNFLFTTGISYRANFVAFLGDADIKVGFYSGIFSHLFLTYSVKPNKNQYTSNIFAELLLPVIPEANNIMKQNNLIPEIKINPEAIQWAREILNPRIKDRYQSKKIFIHPGVSKLSIQKGILKAWPSKYWATLIEKLLENPENTVILLGSKDDLETIYEIHKKLSFFVKPKNYFDLSAIEFSIDKLAALINTSDLLVCADSAPMHISVGLGKKLVAFFGPTNPKKLLPLDPRFQAVHVDNLECRPCLFDKRKESCSKPECLEVTPEMMLQAIERQLSLNKVASRGEIIP